MRDLIKQIQQLDDAMQAINENFEKAEQIRNERLYMYSVATAKTSTYLANPQAYLTTRQARKEIAMKTRNIGLICIDVIIFIFALVMSKNIAVIFKEGREKQGIYIILMLLLVCIVIGIITTIDRKKRTKKYIEELQQITPEENALIEKAKAIAAENAEVAAILPEEYRYPLITGYIRRLFETNRVSTINEALSMADEQIHRWNVEESQRALLAEQQNQSRMIKNIQWQQAWMALDIALMR